MKFDTFIRDYGIDDCDFMKTDIEGGGLTVCSANYGWLSLQGEVDFMPVNPSMSGDLRRGLKEVAGILQ